MVCLPVLARLWQPLTRKGSKAKRARHATATPRPADQAHPRPPAGRAGLRPLSQPGSPPGRRRRLHSPGLARRARPADHHQPAALRRCAYELAPPRTGKPGRAGVKGKRLPELILLAGMTRVAWEQARVRCYGRQRTLDLAGFRCLWYGALARSRSRSCWPDGYELAVVSTDLAATPAELVERYSHRWSLEVCFEESRQVMGVGQARNRTRAAVERTVPFGLACMSLVVYWVRRVQPGPPRTSPPAALGRRGTAPAHPLTCRPAHRVAPGASHRAVSAISPAHAHLRRNPPSVGGMRPRRSMTAKAEPCLPSSAIVPSDIRR